MTYKKKDIQQVAEKYQINVETNELFKDILDMFEDKQNYMPWAVNIVFGQNITMRELTAICDWISKNSASIKLLSKQNIVAYKTKADIRNLFTEMHGVEMINLVKKIASHFNTTQKKMFFDKYKLNEITPLQAVFKLDIIYGLFEKFNKLPMKRKNNVYIKASSLTRVEDILSNVENAIKAVYEWNKEDLLAFVENNTKDCKVVFDQGTCVILRIGSFESSRLLCGGRTQWCITSSSSQWNNYVASYNNREQYFLFDFSRKETDNFAHVGFTISDGKKIEVAQTCNNSSMINGYTQGNERYNIFSLLEHIGAKMTIFLHLKSEPKYSWSYIGITSFADSHKLNVVYCDDKRIIVNVGNNSEALKYYLAHTLINTNDNGYGGMSQLDKDNRFIIFDTSLEYDNEKAITYVTCEKDTYGLIDVNGVKDAYNTVQGKEYITKTLGIKINDFLKRGEIEPSIMLHKLIDDNDEESALKLIEEDGGDLDVNYEFSSYTPLISAVGGRMYKLASKIISHKSFDLNKLDEFGETTFQSLEYIYSSEENAKEASDDKGVHDLLCQVMANNKFNPNMLDIDKNNALDVACSFKKMNWLSKCLISDKKVCVNNVNSFNATAITACLQADNKEILELLCQRPDLTLRDEDIKIAKMHSIDLKALLKPTDSIFGKFKCPSLEFENEEEEALAYANR